MSNKKKLKPNAPRSAKGITVVIAKESFVIPVEALDDFEMMEDLALVETAESEAVQVAAAISALRRMFTADDLVRLKKAMRDPGTGRVPATAMIEAVFEAIKAADPNS